MKVLFQLNRQALFAAPESSLTRPRREKTQHTTNAKSKALLDCITKIEIMQKCRRHVSGVLASIQYKTLWMCHSTSCWGWRLYVCGVGAGEDANGTQKAG